MLECPPTELNVPHKSMPKKLSTCAHTHSVYMYEVVVSDMQLEHSRSRIGNSAEKLLRQSFVLSLVSRDRLKVCMGPIPGLYKPEVKCIPVA